MNARHHGDSGIRSGVRNPSTALWKVRHRAMRFFKLRRPEAVNEYTLRRLPSTTAYKQMERSLALFPYQPDLTLHLEARTALP